MSESIGTPCSVSAPTIGANEALINGSADCQRLALLNFFKTRLGQDESLPVKRPQRNTATLTKLDWNLSADNKLTASYNFDYSKNENQTFDVATYGTSANGTEGPSKINVFNLNLFSSLSPTRLNEAHFTYARESRPRSATLSNLAADTGIGFGPTFRFGNPFFVQPNVDELLWRTQVRDSFSIVSGKHTYKFGGEWLHTLNDQIFRGFFTGRYLFDSVTGFLRYAAPAAAGGFGPRTVACSNGSFVTLPASCGGGSNPTGGPLLFYLQAGIPSGLPDVPPPGASTITNDDFALFVQDKWQIRPNFTLSYGLRWEAQIFPNPIVDPAKTAYAQFLNDPRFPSDGTLPDQKKEFQPRVGFAWDTSNKGKSVLRASWGIYNARQNMLSQVGSITTNGAQQSTNFASTDNIRLFGVAAPVWPGLAPVGPPLPAVSSLCSPACVSSAAITRTRVSTRPTWHSSKRSRGTSHFTWTSLTRRAFT
ncbi:MAG: TonB-dependent receptor [Acidobacteriota bacterium]